MRQAKRRQQRQGDQMTPSFSLSSSSSSRPPLASKPIMAPVLPDLAATSSERRTRTRKRAAATVGWLLFFLCTSTTTTTTDALTPIPYNCTARGCLNNGICVKSSPNTYPQCQCPSNYRGSDCGLEVQICGGQAAEAAAAAEPSMVCYNGGVCVLLEEESLSGNSRQYSCDCPKARHLIPLYAGEFCEQQLYTSCNGLDKKVGEGVFSFCVNGGTCLEYVNLLDSNAHHTACDCSTARAPNNNMEVLSWGDHCEVLHSAKVAAPKEGHEGNNDDQYYAGDDYYEEIPNEPLRIVALVSLSAALVTMIIYILWKVRSEYHQEDQQMAVEQATAAATVVSVETTKEEPKDAIEQQQQQQQQQQEKEKDQKELQLEEGVTTIAIGGTHAATTAVVRVEDMLTHLSTDTTTEEEETTSQEEEEDENRQTATTTTPATPTSTTWKGQMGPDHFIT